MFSKNKVTEMENPTATWNLLHDRFYRRQELYQLNWQDVDLSMYIVAGAPYASPLALVRDDKKILRVQKAAVKPDIAIYSPAGTLLATIMWDKGRIVEMGWSSALELYVVEDDGTCHAYDIHGYFLKSFSLGKQMHVVMARVYSSGIVVLTSECKFFAVTDLADPRPRKMADILELDSLPSCMVVMEPEHTLDGQPELIVSVDKSLYTLDFHTATRRPQFAGPYTHVCVSPDGKLLALFSADGNVHVVASDFTQNLSETFTRTSEPPTQVAWCGSDSVVVAWDSLVLVVGPYNESISYTYESSVFMVTEVDGVRIYSDKLHEFLQKVPDATDDIFKYGSTEPAARLYDASRMFEERDAHADELLRSLKGGELNVAVEQCIEAAGYDFDPHLQKQLLKAASFGKAFVDNYAPERFVNMCKTLRVLNMLRHYTIGMPLTYDQYVRLGPVAAVKRLTQLHEHGLANQICEYLDLSPNDVLMHWACAKVQHGSDDDVVCGTIVKKLSAYSGISYAAIARMAHTFGRSALAIKLLEHEPRAEDQVPLLITLHEDELALDKSIASGDTDLVYMAILHLKKKIALGDFLHVIHNKPVASALLVQWCKENDKALLKDFYYQDDRLLDLALLQVRDAYSVPTVEERFKDLTIALGALSDVKDSGFFKAATEDQLRLLKAQLKLDAMAEAEGTGAKYMDLSAADTVYALLLGRKYKQAETVKKDLRVSDKKFWWLKVRALSYNKDWAELDRFSKLRKSPIGYEPFVDECLAKGAMTEAVKYIPKCRPDTRVSYYCDAGFFREAVEAAQALRSREGLELVRRRCGNRRDIIQMLDKALAAP